MRNFEPSRTKFVSFCGISIFSRIFFGIRYLIAIKGTNAAYFRRVHAAVENYLLHVDMIAPLNTCLPLAV